MSNNRSARSLSAPLLSTDDERPSLRRQLSSSMLSAASLVSEFSEAKVSRKWRHTVGICLLLVTVVLWTASNFLASTIFADNTYSKPYFLTYISTAFFLIPLIPILLKQAFEDPSQLEALRSFWRRDSKPRAYSVVEAHDDDDDDDDYDEGGNDFLKPAAEDGPDRRSGSPSGRMLVDDSSSLALSSNMGEVGEKLTVAETARLSLEFCILWFLANYFMNACLEYTTVASSTILTSTSSIWTLIVGSIFHVEHFTFRKLIGVFASLAGIILISTVDVSSTDPDDPNRGTFPHKTAGEIALGDTLALISAVLYGFYTVLMKKRLGVQENLVNMPLFFGLVGLFNCILLWPGLFILHWIGIEPFALPPTERITAIVMINCASSLVSDFCWAFAMLLTSPLVVTVGLSLTIPLSLIGQMIISGQYSSAMYWVGAVIVLGSFLFINREENRDEEVMEVARIVEGRME